MSGSAEILQVIREFLSSSMQTNRNVRGARTQHNTDVADAQALPCRQQQQLAIVVRQEREGPVNVCIDVVEHPNRIVDAFALGSPCESESTGFAAMVVRDTATSDTEAPRQLSTFRYVVEPPPDGHPGLGDDVVGVDGGPDPAARISPDRAEVLLIDRFEARNAGVPRGHAPQTNGPAIRFPVMSHAR